MGLISKIYKAKENPVVAPTPVEPLESSEEVVLTDQEVDFILLKLRESTYKGHEFEKYATIYSKLSTHILKNR
jgi:hypothetical protein